MTTSQLPYSPIHVAPESPAVWWRVVTAAVTGLLAIGAYYGTWYLTEDLAIQQLPVAPPEFLPGTGWGFGAFALLLFVAAPMSVAFLTAAMGHPMGPAAAIGAGGLLVVWIVIQVLLIGLVFWLQPACFLLGAVVLGLGLVAYRSDR